MGASGPQPAHAAQAESVVQDRENQRRSRARRRDHVQRLEARVQEFERAGAQATVEMQQAARAVHVENQSLRAILASFGLSPADIDARVRHIEAEGGNHVVKGGSGTPSLSSACPSFAEPATPLEKPCEEAAAILIQLGHGSDTSSIRATLGCAGEGPCFVRNTELMQLMERATDC